MAAWQRARASIVYLSAVGQPTSVAVCIDARGYFMALKGAAPYPTMTAKLADGATFTVSAKETDDITGLTLLIVNGTPGILFQPASGVQAGAKVPKQLLAVMGTGPIRAELSSEGKAGIFSEKRRLLPLTEVRFEASSQSVAGALLFTLDGALAGILNATLQSEANRQQAAVGQTQSLTPPSTAVGGGLAGASGLATKAFGPGGLTVGYSTSPSVIQRVAEGFRSPSHKVLYPTLGITCSDAPMGGAQVRSVLHNSPALRAGLLADDVLIEMGGQRVANQVDFARIMLDQRIGASMALRILRGNREVVLSAVVSATQG